VPPKRERSEPCEGGRIPGLLVERLLEGGLRRDVVARITVFANLLKQRVTELDPKLCLLRVTC